MTNALDIMLADVASRRVSAEPLDAPLPIDSIPTPALLLDEAAFERNVAKMAAFLHRQRQGFRPHAKTHKCPVIAHRQMAAGAVGICAAKVAEAVVMVNAGISDVLITSPVLDARKAAAVASLTRKANVDVVVDSLDGMKILEQVADADAR